jgi:hypothetical protein
MELDSLSSTNSTPIEEGSALSTSSTLVRSAQASLIASAVETPHRRLLPRVSL